MTGHHQQQKTWSGQLRHHAQLVGLGPRTQSHVSDLRLFVPSTVHDDESARHTAIRVQVPYRTLTFCACCDAVSPAAKAGDAAPADYERPAAGVRARVACAQVTRFWVVGQLTVWPISGGLASVRRGLTSRIRDSVMPALQLAGTTAPSPAPAGVGRAIAISLAKQGASAPDGDWRGRPGVRAGHGRCRPGTKPTASRLPARCSHYRPVRDKNLLKTERDGVSRVQRGGQPSASKTAVGSR
jgi:hypothetical protein